MIRTYAALSIVTPLYCMAGVFLWLHFAGGEVLSYSETKAEIVGDRVNVTRTYQKERDCRTVSVNHTLQRDSDQYNYIVPVQFSNVILNSTAGKKTTVKMSAIIPYKVLPGNYVVRSDISWKCNPVQYRSHRTVSNSFYVK